MLHLNVAFAVWLVLNVLHQLHMMQLEMLWFGWPLGERNAFGISPKPLCVFLGFVFVFSPPDDEKISRESRGLELGSRAERPMRKLISDGGEITKTRFGYFSRLLVCFGCFGF